MLQQTNDWRENDLSPVYGIEVYDNALKPASQICMWVKIFEDGDPVVVTSQTQILRVTHTHCQQKDRLRKVP